MIEKAIDASGAAGGVVADGLQIRARGDNGGVKPHRAAGVSLPASPPGYSRSPWWWGKGRPRSLSWRPVCIADPVRAQRACHMLSAAPSCESDGCVDVMLSVGFASCGRGSGWRLDEIGDVESATVRTIGELRLPVGRRARVHVSTAVPGGSSQTTSLHLGNPAA